MKTAEELKQERLLVAVSSLVRIKQEIENTIVRISQLDGAITVTEELEKPAE
jgi:hypothetical protein